MIFSTVMAIAMSVEFTQLDAAPIHDAAARNDLVALQQELDNVDINSIDDKGYTPLMIASLHGHLGIVKMLIDRNADVNIQSEDGHTALSQAVFGRHIDIVEQLRSTHISVNSKDKMGNIPLMSAVLSDNPEKDNYVDIVRCLLQFPGIDVSIENSDGKTALDIAQNREIKDLLQEHINKIRSIKTKSARK